MDAAVGRLFESIGSFFSGGEAIPWCDRQTIAALEREAAEASKDESPEKRCESIMRLSWALVHSTQPDDVQRGIAMVEASLANKSGGPLEKREKIYLLAVGYYRTDDFAKSRQLVEQCLQIAPDWRQALTLKKTVEDKIAKDGVVGIGLTATAVGVVFGVVAALARRG